MSGKKNYKVNFSDWSFHRTCVVNPRTGCGPVVTQVLHYSHTYYSCVVQLPGIRVKGVCTTASLHWWAQILSSKDLFASPPTNLVLFGKTKKAANSTNHVPSAVIAEFLWILGSCLINSAPLLQGSVAIHDFRLRGGLFPLSKIGHCWFDLLHSFWSERKACNREFSEVRVSSLI